MNESRYLFFGTVIPSRLKSDLERTGIQRESLFPVAFSRK